MTDKEKIDLAAHVGIGALAGAALGLALDGDDDLPAVVGLAGAGLGAALWFSKTPLRLLAQAPPPSIFAK